MKTPSWIKITRSSVSAYERATLTQKRTVRTELEAVNLLRPRLGTLIHEEMHVIMLDGDSKVMHLAVVAVGGIHGIAVSARDVLRPAIAIGASRFILAHNHPSGDPTPSVEDRQFTRAAVIASDTVGLPIADHIIIAGSKHVSMLEADPSAWDIESIVEMQFDAIKKKRRAKEPMVGPWFTS